MLTFNALTNTNTITKSTMDGIINMSSGFAGLDVGSDIQLSSSIQTILNGNSLTKSTMGITMSCDYAGLHITSSLQLSSDAGLGVLSTNTTNLNTF